MRTWWTRPAKAWQDAAQRSTWGGPGASSASWCQRSPRRSRLPARGRHTAAGASTRHRRRHRGRPRPTSRPPRRRRCYRPWTRRSRRPHPRGSSRPDHAAATVGRRPTLRGRVDRWPLVGRAALLAELAGGGRGRRRRRGSVVLAGPAGVGKSRLAAELGALDAARGTDVRTVTATAATQPLPLAALAEAVPTVASADPAAGLRRVSEQLRSGGRDLLLVVDD